MSNKKYFSVDFEYYNTAESKLKLVCGAIKTSCGFKQAFWLYDGGHMDAMTDAIEHYHNQGYIFLAYNLIAEGRSFLSMDIDPMDYKWIDLYLEYRCLSNHNDNYAYGKQLINGRKKFTKRPLPKWQRKTEADEKKADASKQEYGMGAAVYKTLGVVIDTDFKKEIRDLIIACNSGDPKDIAKMVARRKEILAYCLSDVEYLEPMWKSMVGEYRRLLGTTFKARQLWEDISNRAEYAIRTARMEVSGYPINVNRTRNFSSQVPNILWKCQNDINSQFPFTGGDRIFRNKVQKRPLELSWNQSKTRELLTRWMDENNYKSWTLTDGGKSGIKELSLSLKAFQKPISYSHTYKRGDLISQMQRYLKLKQGLNGFTGNGKNKKNFWDSVGKDGRVRPYMGIYGAQSSRSQPSATSFIPLKSSWMRSFIFPPKGKWMAGIDWASQEYLVAALLSGDKNMIKAYASGDVYLAFAKDSGVVPQSATKATHKAERDLMKPIILGQQFDLTEFGLARQLTESTGKKTTPEEALKWINRHKRAYPTLWSWKAKIQREYKLKKHLRLPDGWMMWGDNDNFRSAGNYPIQGLSACIMRKAVALAQDAGVHVSYTLHDALYIEFDKGNFKDVITLAECMDAAFRFYFPKELQSIATCRMDADVWGEGAEESEFNLKYIGDGKELDLPVKSQVEYLDPRGIAEYNMYSVYFEEESYDSCEF